MATYYSLGHQNRNKNFELFNVQKVSKIGQNQAQFIKIEANK